MKISFSFLLLFITQLSFAQKVIKLYDGKPKGSENWAWSEQTAANGFVYNVTEPTLTDYMPLKHIANGTALVVVPGGAFHILSVQNEGKDVARWLNSKGIAAFVLKYRVVHSVTDDPIKEIKAKMMDSKSLDEENGPIVPLAMADGLAAIKYVRDNAKSLNIDPQKIGMMSFSAGGTVIMSLVYNATDENRSNFIAPIYAYEPAIIGSLIPCPRNKTTSVIYYDHIGVYAFRKQALLNFTNWPITPLENAEKIECLRYLEHGIPLRMVVVDYMGIEIDAPDNLERASKLLYFSDIPFSKNDCV